MSLSTGRTVLRLARAAFPLDRALSVRLRGQPWSLPGPEALL